MEPLITAEERANLDAALAKLEGERESGQPYEGPYEPLTTGIKAVVGVGDARIVNNLLHDTRHVIKIVELGLLSGLEEGHAEVSLGQLREICRIFEKALKRVAVVETPPPLVNIDLYS
jgi:hypothetical protein